MRFILYAGPAPTRDEVLAFAGPILRRAASAVVLVTGGGPSNEPLLREAQRRLDLPDSVTQTLRAHAGDAYDALVREAGRREADLAVVGRLQPRLGRLLRGQRSKRLAQRLSLAVLRVQGRAGLLRRILLTSGGDAGTIENARQVGRLAAPLGASVTILHAISQQSLFFEGFDAPPRSVDSFLASRAPEAEVLREAAALLRELGVQARVQGRASSVLDTVVAEARGHDLLAIGAHRVASPLDRILLEDLAGDILDLSPIPVFVGRGGAHQR